MQQAHLNQNPPKLSFDILKANKYSSLQKNHFSKHKNKSEKIWFFNLQSINIKSEDYSSYLFDRSCWKWINCFNSYLDEKRVESKGRGIENIVFFRQHIL